ncbi:unnamed protein product [Cuscuta epithymum]|uniref:Uncharacterized protein n=1 Tax=Cuscuta epithymum TaxID=186058 RepID=A0AAV0EPC1_9ASTE|nr:unnamed protein product [Cuscuta epithymum]
MSDIRGKQSPTMNDFTWDAVEEYKRSKQFQTTSISGKRNRIACGDKCKQYGSSQAAFDVAGQEVNIKFIFIYVSNFSCFIG